MVTTLKLKAKENDDTVGILGARVSLSFMWRRRTSPGGASCSPASTDGLVIVTRARWSSPLVNSRVRRIVRVLRIDESGRLSWCGNLALIHLATWRTPVMALQHNRASILSKRTWVDWHDNQTRRFRGSLHFFALTWHLHCCPDLGCDFQLGGSQYCQRSMSTEY